MLWTQVHIACILTSWFFVFCTGEMEAWAQLFYSGEDPTQTELREGAWTGCYPIAGTYRHSWRHDDCFMPGRGNESDLPWDSVLGIEDDEVFTEFENVMAPNVECWEEVKVNHSRPLCDQPLGANVAGTMGERQLSKRAMLWLILNHVQIFLVYATCHLVPTHTVELREQVKRHARRQKELIAMAVFAEEREAELQPWHKLRGAVKSLAAMKRRRRVLAASGAP
jgi:hypothetical protein